MSETTPKAPQAPASSKLVNLYKPVAIAALNAAMLWRPPVNATASAKGK